MNQKQFIDKILDIGAMYDQSASNEERKKHWNDADKLVLSFISNKVKEEIGPICPECDNPNPHLYENGGGHCEDCNHQW